MPRVSPHVVKSAIRLERQSTMVPKTSNTSAFTAETSDMSISSYCCSCSLLCWPAHSKQFAILHEPRIIRDLIVQDPRLRIAGLGQPVYPAAAIGFCLYVHRLDQRAAEPKPARAVDDEQILQIAVIARRPARAMIEILDDAGQPALDIGAEQEHRFA